MHIESHSTGERRTRMLIFLAMCGVFAGWFAYDGYKGYPNENLKQVLKDLPAERPADLQMNPRVNKQQLNIIEQRLKDKQPVTPKDLEELLGEPTWDQSEELTYLYLGTDWTAVVRIADDKVLSVTSQKAENRPPAKITYVQRDRLGQVRPGMSRNELRELLGKPSEEKTRTRTLWYVGPAAHAAFPITNDKVIADSVVRREAEKPEGDIFMQKVLAGILAIIAILVAFKFYRVLKLRVVLDDDGLDVNGKRIGWDAMTGLKTDDYVRKGWVDLVYQQGRRTKQYRLDSYHISRFKELVQAICERKGFTSPLATAVAEE